MRGFLKHEFLKSRNRVLILTFCMTALLSCYFLYNGWALSKIDFAANQQAMYNAKSTQLENSVTNYFQTQGLTAEDGKEITDSLNVQKQLLQNMMDFNRKGDWKAELRDAIKQLEMEQAMSSMGVLPNNPYLAQTLEHDKYFLSHSIKPKNSAFACDGLNVLVMISRKFLFLLLPFCVLLLSVGAWLSESSGGALKLLLWQARPKTRILLDKFIVSWIESVASLAVSCLLVFLVCLLLFGLGELEYPIFLDNGQILTTGDMIVRTAKTVPAATFVLTAVSSLPTGKALLKAR